MGGGNIRVNCIAPGYIFASMVGDMPVNYVNYGSRRGRGEPREQLGILPGLGSF